MRAGQGLPDREWAPMTPLAFSLWEGKGFRSAATRGNSAVQVETSAAVASGCQHAGPWCR